jgi:hypothetical protein
MAEALNHEDWYVKCNIAQKNGKFYEGGNMTVPEFKAFNVESLS